MRVPFFAGNWKMHMTRRQAADFAEKFKELYRDTDVRTAICAPYVHLEFLKKAFAGTKIGVGAQNVHFEDEGAFTGEISAPMLEEIGLDYCIVGHSERRQYFGETDETVNRKLKSCSPLPSPRSSASAKFWHRGRQGRKRKLSGARSSRRWKGPRPMTRKSSSSPMSPYGPSEPARRQRPNRPARCAA